MARRRKEPDDDDDDDFVPRVGRPRGREVFGPKKPELYERESYFRRLDAILDALEIGELERDVRLSLQKTLQRCDSLRSVDPKRFPEDGDGVVTMLLRSIAESSNGPSALTLPIIDAVRSCMHDAWTNRGLAWLEAMDQVPLVRTYQELCRLGVEKHLGDAIRHMLTQILGPPVAPAPPKPKPAPKKMVKPQGVSAATWDEIIVMIKDRKKRPKARMAA